MCGRTHTQICDAEADINTLLYIYVNLTVI